MRKDQPELKKQFDSLNDYISLLEQSIDEQQIEIDYLKEENKEIYQKELISRIEYDRLLTNKPSLTNRYSIARKMMAEINAGII